MPDHPPIDSRILLDRTVSIPYTLHSRKALNPFISSRFAGVYPMGRKAGRCDGIGVLVEL
jgi:hypothetical protein